MDMDSGDGHQSASLHSGGSIGRAARRCAVRRPDRPGRAERGWRSVQPTSIVWRPLGHGGARPGRRRGAVAARSRSPRPAVGRGRRRAGRPGRTAEVLAPSGHDVRPGAATGVVPEVVPPDVRTVLDRLGVSAHGRGRQPVAQRREEKQLQEPRGPASLKSDLLMAREEITALLQEHDRCTKSSARNSVGNSTRSATSS